VAVIHPDRRVLAVCGDAGFDEFAGARDGRAESELVMLVLEDRACGLIRWEQEVDKADVPDSAQYVRCRGGEQTSSFHNV